MCALRSVNTSDLSVQRTNDDAQVSKLSCVDKGYFRDDFLKYFVRRASRRSPLINRGYFSRVLALRQILQEFHAHLTSQGVSTVQILSLGAGFDTSFFNLQAPGPNGVRWFEVDFAEVTKRKAAIIAGNEPLRKLLGPAESQSIQLDEGRITAEAYNLLPGDLRDTRACQAALEAAGFDPACPTYVLAECVLVYMEPEDSASVVRWLGHWLPTAAFVVYEQIKPNDAFGKQMISNLEARGCPLKGIAVTSDLAAHIRRFTGNGWQRADAKDMSTIYRLHLDPAEKKRAEQLEIFDEFEEWHMIQDHYCLVLGVNGGGDKLTGFGLKQQKQTLLGLTAGRMAGLPNAD
ncbi:g3526 [Coccomyxa viridis]|uniref:Leucine carboxyl methyltransferase 1 homolog n=1 Tax=Coccomyxa viridis TaxID=1274662 RepID=A0ABP1FMZ8_9CHLO